MLHKLLYQKEEDTDRGLKPAVHDNNFVKIGVNASTGEITLVKTKLLDVQEISEVVLDSDINQYIDSLPKEDSLRYVKSYSWDKTTGELRPIIYSINYQTTDIKVLKRY